MAFSADVFSDVQRPQFTSGKQSECRGYKPSWSLPSKLEPQSHTSESLLSRKKPTSSQLVRLASCVDERPQRPLCFSLLLVDRPQAEHIRVQVESRPDLRQHHVLLYERRAGPCVGRLVVRVVSEGDEVRVIGEGEHALGVLLGHGEEVGEQRAEALAQRRLEVVEDEVRIRLRHGGLALLLLDVVPHDAVGQREEGCRPVRQMADDERIRLAARLLHHDQVREVRLSCCTHDLLDRRVTAVDALRVGHDEPHLHHELLEARGRLTRRGDAHLRIAQSCPRVLIIDM